MLTKTEIMEAARLMDQTGEPRPGFLHEDAASLEGPAMAHSSSTRNRKGRKAPSGKASSVSSRGVSICLIFKEDPETGEVLLVKK